MSAKVPAVVSLSKQALIENKCVVIGLQSTGEARTEDAVKSYVSVSSFCLLNYRRMHVNVWSDFFCFFNRYLIGH